MRDYFVAACVLTCLVESAGGQSPKTNPRPTLGDFIGLCVHTVQFRPDLYAPIARQVRDYHDLQWDLGDRTDLPAPFPLARNGVNWADLYGGWMAAGYRIDASVVLANTPPEKWADLDADAYRYGKAFATSLGPTGGGPVEAIEIGNEPGKYDDQTYRRVLRHMARGVRDADPAMKIVSCAIKPGPSGDYRKSLDLLRDLSPFYDVLNIHVYAEAEAWPTWRRSFPEDSSIDFLDHIDAVIAWRDLHAPDKEIWITEFGWDASTKPATGEGTFAQWIGSTESEQARYLVRSILLFSAMAVDRAYIFWFNDQDAPHTHGSSGITRHYTPKPAYHALAHLQRVLGDFRGSKAIIRRPGEMMVYEFRHRNVADQVVWAVWSPTGFGRSAVATLDLAGFRLLGAERMPLNAESAQAPVVVSGQTLRLTVDESPTYLRLQKTR